MKDIIHERTVSIAGPKDWTIDPETGASNSSPEFLELAEFVGSLVRPEARRLVSGGHPTDSGRLIMAQLAHVKNVGPLPPKENSEHIIT